MTLAQISQTSAAPARPAGAEPSAAANGDGSFAQLMALQAPADASAESEAEASSSGSATPQRADADTVRAGDPRGARRAAQGPRQSAQKSDSAREAETGAERSEHKQHDDKAQAAETSPAPDPTLAHTLAHWLHEQKGDTASTGRATARTDAQTAVAAADGVDAPSTPNASQAHAAPHGVRGTHGAEKAAHERSAAAQALSRAAAHDSHASPDPSAVAAATSRDTELAQASHGSFALPAGFEAASGSVQSSTAPAAAPTPDAGTVSVPVAVPIDTPDFAHAVGVQVSLLAKDGVQKAELHLNPAETGPVSVQIALDGDKARVDFGAQAASTRAAIEASLPELAAALRDAGFTLAGGGVSQNTGQHAGQRGNDPDADARGARAGGSGTGDGSAAAPQGMVRRARVSAGGVDLYA